MLRQLLLHEDHVQSGELQDARRRKVRSLYGHYQAAPSAIAVTSPSGTQMPDGFSTKLAFSLLASCPMWELNMKSGGLDGGEPIRISSMRNTLWHTAKFRTLIEAQPTTIDVSFAPNMYKKIKDTLLNKNGTVTEWFPDGSTLSYYGGINKMGEMELKEGELPKCTITITKTNLDSSGNEFGPVLSPASGT